MIFVLVMGLWLTNCSHTPPAQELSMKRAEHHLSDGRFRNRFVAEMDKPVSDLISWQWERRSPRSTTFPLAENDPAFLKGNRTERTVTWVGHSTLLVQVGGINILTDPHFGQRASPVGFAGPKRYTPPGIRIEDLPDIDIVVISHNHYDHLDRPSIEALWARRTDDGPTFFVPLRMKSWFENLGVDRVVELDWWDSASWKTARVHAVPVQHWSSRSPFDRNQVLWAGWVVEISDFRFFFAGDTGYSPDFKEIGERFGGFDLSAIPIGAYAPRWFMKDAHCNPAEAVQIHQDVGSIQSVGIHWGTFPLTDEPYDEPPQLLRDAMEEAGLSPAQFWTLDHGETRFLGDAVSKSMGPED
jgi:L-ascorbate metabolism protein UlaG (beta-lactamase superfamily)